MNSVTAKTAPLSISVIVPAYNAAHYLVRSLPPLIAMRDRGEIEEVLVVDDCSTEASNIETAERLGATVIRMKENGGPGAARNCAAKLAKGDIFWLVDADVVAHETGASILKEAFAERELAAAFGSYDSDPPADNFASQYKNLVHRYYHQRGRADSESFWSGCGAIRKSVYFELGGFDCERYGRPSIEDVELGFRMRGAGLKIRLLPDLLGTHLKFWTLSEVVRTDIFQRAVPWSHLILSGRGMSDDLNVSGTERVKAGFAGLWFLSLFACLLPGSWPAAPAAALAMTVIVGLMNADLFRFFRGNRGIAFAIPATAFHQVYYLYSAVTFTVCALKYHFGGKKEVFVSRVADGKPAV